MLIQDCAYIHPLFVANFMLFKVVFDQPFQPFLPYSKLTNNPRNIGSKIQELTHRKLIFKN